MAEFFFFLAILFQCGIFPMGWSDCERRPVVERPASERAAEHAEAP